MQLWDVTGDVPFERKKHLVFSVICVQFSQVTPSEICSCYFYSLLVKSLRFSQHSQGDPEVLGYFASNSLHKDDETVRNHQKFML